MAENKLDTLEAHRRITAGENFIINEYAGWQRLICGSSHARAIDYTGGNSGGGEIPDGVFFDAERLFKAASKAMMSVSREAKMAIDAVAIENRWPTLTLDGKSAILSKRDETMPFYQGVRALVAWRRGERKAA